MSLNSGSEKKILREIFRKSSTFTQNDTDVPKFMNNTRKSYILVNKKSAYGSKNTTFSVVFACTFFNCLCFREVPCKPPYKTTIKQTTFQNPTTNPLPHSFSPRSLLMLFPQWQTRAQKPRKKKNRNQTGTGTESEL